MKAWQTYPNVREAWQKNLDAYNEDPMQYFETISQACYEGEVERFRWHVGGDIPDINYFHGMNLVAKANPETQFLCFTKRLFVYNRASDRITNIPDNMRYIFSMWPGLWPQKDTLFGQEGGNLPIAWYLPKECEDESYKNAVEDAKPESVECNGKCDDCFMCWYLEPGMSVILKEH
jgi:hypothetical protein